MIWLPPGVQPGDRVTAKRYGWDQDPVAAAAADVDLYDYPDDDLAGVLQVRQVPESRIVKAYTQYLVGGQVADGKTIRPIADGDAAGPPPEPAPNPPAPTAEPNRGRSKPQAKTPTRPKKT